MTRSISIITEGFPGEAALDIAVSRALLSQVGAATVGETFRLHVPGRVVAFGKHDTLTAGYGDAVAAARLAGFSPEERLAGGRAAVFHELTLSFSWTIPETNPTGGVQARFEQITDLIVRSFARMGIDSIVGEIPGEYCPGRFSVHHRGRIKLMGVGQRLSRDAVHVGGVIVVGGSALMNEALAPVYAALGLMFDPAATGSLQDVDPAITIERTQRAVLAELEQVAETEQGRLDEETMALARDLAPHHIADRPRPPAPPG